MPLCLSLNKSRLRVPCLPPLPPPFPKNPFYPILNWAFSPELGIFPIPFPLLQKFLHGLIQELPRRLPFLEREHLHPLPEIGVDEAADEGPPLPGLLDGLCDGHSFLPLRLDLAFLLSRVPCLFHDALFITKVL